MFTAALRLTLDQYDPGADTFAMPSFWNEVQFRIPTLV